jgi:hypothetical protein
MQGASHKLAFNIIENCANKLEPIIHSFLSSCIFNKDMPVTELRRLYHKIILEIFQCAPQILFAVIPSLTHELLVCYPPFFVTPLYLYLHNIIPEFCSIYLCRVTKLI